MAAFAEARRAEGEGDRTRAMDLFAEVVRNDPSLADLGMRVAAHCLQTGRLEEAIEHLSSVLAENPGQPHVLGALALAHAMRGDPAKARHALGRALALDPAFPSAHALGYDLDVREQSPANALASLAARAGPAAKDSVFWEKTGEAYAQILTERDKLAATEVARRSLPLFERALALGPDRISLNVRIADMLAKTDRAAEAAPLLEKAVRAEPARDELRTRLALAYLASQRLPDAARAMEEVVRRNPEHASLQAALAELYAQTRNHAGMVSALEQAASRGAEPVDLAATAVRAGAWNIAEKYLTVALDRNPAQPALWLRLAHALLAQDKAAAAATTLGEARRRFPGSLQILITSAVASREADRPGEAAEFLKEAMRLNQGPPPGRMADNIHFEWGVLCERQGDLAGMEDHFQRALLANAADHRSMNYLSYSWADRGMRLEEAMALIRRALALAPDNPAYIDTLGWIYFQQGRYEDAVRELRRAIDAGGDDSEIHEHLGDALEKLGRHQEAQAAWKRAAELDPSRKAPAEKAARPLP